MTSVAVEFSVGMGSGFSTVIINWQKSRLSTATRAVVASGRKALAVSELIKAIKLISSLRARVHAADLIIFRRPFRTSRSARTSCENGVSRADLIRRYRKARARRPIGN